MNTCDHLIDVAASLGYKVEAICPIKDIVFLIMDKTIFISPHPNINLRIQALQQAIEFIQNNDKTAASTNERPRRPMQPNHEFMKAMTQT